MTIEEDILLKKWSPLKYSGTMKYRNEDLINFAKHYRKEQRTQVILVAWD